MQVLVQIRANTVQIRAITVQILCKYKGEITQNIFMYLHVFARICSVFAQYLHLFARICMYLHGFAVGKITHANAVQILANTVQIRANTCKYCANTVQILS